MHCIILYVNEVSQGFELFSVVVHKNYIGSDFKDILTFLALQSNIFMCYFKTAGNLRLMLNFMYHYHLIKY